MKKLIVVLMLGLFTISCGELGKILETADEILGEDGVSGITSSEAVSGLKEALTLGVGNGTGFLGKKDGFLKNAAYKILMPKEVRDIESKIRGNFAANAIAGPFLDKVVTAMNRGSENAMAEAKPIFVNAIKSMTFKDALGIVTGGDGAATSYLKSTTSTALKGKFRPVIKTALDKVNINEPWTKVSQGYNMITGKAVQTDLNDYVTDGAMTGLFSQIRKEEDNIRKDPLARTSDILKKVFAYADNNK